MEHHKSIGTLRNQMIELEEWVARCLDMLTKRPRDPHLLDHLKSAQLGLADTKAALDKAEDTP